MEHRNRVAAGAAAAVLAVVGGGVKFGERIGELLHGAHPAPVVVRPPLGRVAIGAAHVQSQVETFVAAAGDRVRATPEEARRAAKSAACQVLYIAATDGRVPTDREWVSIALGALQEQAIRVPVGSPTWIKLQQVEHQAIAEVVGPDGDVDESESESLAGDLACSWA